jgi:hypothetical protein
MARQVQMLNVTIDITHKEYQNKYYWRVQITGDVESVAYCETAKEATDYIASKLWIDLKQEQ